MKCKKLIRIVIKVTLVIIAFILVITLYNFFDPPPESIFSVKKSLNESLTIGFTHISTERGRHEYDRYKENIYYFKDENGIVFNVCSGHFGGSPFSSRYTICSYAYELLKAAEEPLQDTFNSTPGLKWRKSDNTNNYEILIDSEQELTLAANGVSKAIQAVPPFPIKRQDYKYDGITFGVPDIWVYIQYVNVKSDEKTKDVLSHFSFLCEGEEMPTEEQILQELQRGYDELVEKGEIQE